MDQHLLKYRKLALILGGSSLLLSSCAAQLDGNSSSSIGSTDSIPPGTSQTLTSARIQYLQSNFYSLISPNAVGCAGDASQYYDPLNLDSNGNPVKFDPTVADPNTTVRPSFLKNVSVEITNASSKLLSNQASACSFGITSTSPPPSSCAIFDYDLSYGASATPEGKLLLFGGMQSTNYLSLLPSGTPSLTYQGSTVNCGVAYLSTSLTSSSLINTCNPFFYGLGSNILSANAVNLGLTPGLTSASGPISMWYNLTNQATNSGPSQGIAGAAAAFNSLVNRLVIFGGSSPTSYVGSLPSGSNSFDTWLFDFNQNKWYRVGSTNIDSAMTYTTDTDANGYSTYINKSEGARALFGYLSASGAAFSRLSTDATAPINSATGAQIDTTDRILILGGRGLAGQAYCNNDGMCSDIHRFNPTFGPELMDNSTSYGATTTPAANTPTQWIENYHTTLLTNAINASPTPSPTAYPSLISAFYAQFPVLNKQPYAPPLSFSSALLKNLNNNTSGVYGTSYVMSVGGFYGYSGNNGVLNSDYDAATGYINCSNNDNLNNKCGALSINFKWKGATAGYTHLEGERRTGNFLGISNTSSGSRLTPTQWTQISESGNNTAPWFGGGVALPGLNIPLSAAPGPTPTSEPNYNADPGAYLNQVVHFGGSDCRDYILSNTQCSRWPQPGNRGRYWVFGTDPAYTGTSYPTTLGWGNPSPTPTGTTIPLPPINAGIAAARGVDPDGNPIIVAWGGVTAAGRPDLANYIYYLYNKNNVPTWGIFVTPDSSTDPTISTVRPPVAYVNSAMVFSHVTKKFYLFGGVNLNFGPTSSLSETWELSLVNPALDQCGKGTKPCKFKWRQLKTSEGMTCYPYCPAGRRSHRLVEVDYNNTSTPREPVCSNASKPCSFGIFMQGGTPDGTENTATGSGLTNNTASDRWMFDPTANAGYGHWQLVNTMPPRTLAMMSSVSYQSALNQIPIHRAVLFGGETGLENPTQAASDYLPVNGSPQTRYFIPPTLGDTWIFDYDAGSWNRAKLHGKRYSAVVAGLDNTSSRSASLITDTSTSILSPPPLSGAMMVTRTLSKANHSKAGIPKNLKIPEVYLFGGRDKTGKYHTLDSVYKFCIGSTGEKPVGSPFVSESIPAPDDASCDAYEVNMNPSSLSPATDYSGRWLYKNPAGANGITPSRYGSYLGAATYDSSRDLIITFGGLSLNSSNTPPLNTAITDGSNRIASSTLLEYIPAAQYNTSDQSLKNGSWSVVPTCGVSQTPSGRYGHSLSFNPNKQQLILVGGYNSTGALLTQTQTASTGGTYTQPEVWLGNRIEEDLPNGDANQGIPVIKNGTYPCYYWQNLRIFGNSPTDTTNPPPSTGIAHAISFFIPSSGFSTGYYTLYDRSCVNQGIIGSTDPDVNKLIAGGTYFDIDRSQLRTNENLLLNVTFIPFGTNNLKPDQTNFNQAESAVFKVHLIRTGQSIDTLRQALQPRNLTYAAPDAFPKIVDTLSILAPPTGEIQQAQVLIPLSADPRIDRIKIERYSGSAILIDAEIYKMQPPK